MHRATAGRQWIFLFKTSSRSARQGFENLNFFGTACAIFLWWAEICLWRAGWSHPLMLKLGVRLAPAGSEYFICGRVFNGLWPGCLMLYNEQRTCVWSHMEKDTCRGEGSENGWWYHAQQWCTSERGYSVVLWLTYTMTVYYSWNICKSFHSFMFWLVVICINARRLGPSSRTPMCSVRL